MKHTGMRHLWFTEQQTGHKWCDLCGEHAPDSKGKCVEYRRPRGFLPIEPPRPVNAIAGPQTAPPRGVR